MGLDMLMQYLANALSIITISMCLVLKVPQIMKLLSNKSAVGISKLGLFFEVMRYKL